MSIAVEFDSKKISVWHHFLQVHERVLLALTRELLTAQDLPLTWYNVLARLNQTPQGGLRLQDLAGAITLSQSGLTRLLDRMADMELVERKPCRSDRRGTYAMITPAGQELLAQAQPIYHQAIREQFLQYLTAEEVDALAQIFSKIIAAERPA